jgi:hypothetical protein
MFNKIEDMHSNMKSFTIDIEQRLDQIYKNGAAGKFGFEDVVESANKKIKAEMSEKEKQISKIESYAASYLAKNKPVSSGAITSDGSKALKPKMLKSKPEEKKR